MRIAAITDIHGNLPALEAVLADLRRHSPDVILNLGDHLSGPLQAAATADLLMSESFVTIRGNHERQLLDNPTGASDVAALAQLNDRHKQWIRSLPPTHLLEPDILLCHGTPDSDLEYLLEEVDPDGVHLAPMALVQQRLGDARSKLILCGHSHTPRAVSLSDGTFIVNPGSVGLQAYNDTHPYVHHMETGSPHARYVVLDRQNNSWRAKFVTVAYDWNSAARLAAAGNRPDWAHALATGFASSESV